MDQENTFLGGSELKSTFIRYASFWKFFVLSIAVSSIFAFLYLRYSTYYYKSTAKIQIIDKAQDSEMALPTAMTIFNRSLVNLENEIGVLSSYRLHERVVKKLKSNISFISVGNIVESINHPDDWLLDYDFRLLIDLDSIVDTNVFEIKIKDDFLEIKHFDKDDSKIAEYNFDNLTTFSKKNKLPFELSIKKYDQKILNKKIILHPIEKTTDYFQKRCKIFESGSDSDQLNIEFEGSNEKINEEYLSTLLLEFDNDGISDRQLEYKRTIDFADSRSEFLQKELSQIEFNKQNFKEKNNLTNIETDAQINVEQKFLYNSELFNALSQKDLIKLLESTISEDDFDLMPVNIGIENSNINELINEYNIIVKDRKRYLISAGPNNNFVKSLENEINEYKQSINKSIENYRKSLDINIKSLKAKELEFSNIYRNIPENEKILRSIERELEVKESLFLLLLQKREEAAINFAVVKPSIKIVDNPRTSIMPHKPNKPLTIFISVFAGISLPFIILYLVFYTDTKIHTRDQLEKMLDSIPIIGEMPYIKNLQPSFISTKNDLRNPLLESVRMIIANLNFILFDKSRKNYSNVLLVTSSVKGEGKTIVSTHLASLLSIKENKVLLIGADLRNPQIHKYFGVEKNIPGLSDFIYKNDKNIKNYIQKYDSLDVLFSGTIPPNPTELLASKSFKELLKELKTDYDFIVIDSAPCLIVSDTFEISKLVDSTVYICRSNYTDQKIISFINNSKKENRLNSLNVVLNSVGNSQSYGYKYGYQYGYRYGYKYSYNYGYGYDYKAEK